MKRLVTIALVLGGLSGTIHAQLSAPLFEVPAPTGKLPIGTTRWVVTDPSRDESFAPGRKREVEVIAWYPRAGEAGDARAVGEAGGNLAPYIRDSMEEVHAFGRLAKVGDAWNRLVSVTTHAILDAAPAQAPARFPVIVFQHGYTGLPSSYTTLLEDLASHGWVVLNVIHPYEAAGARLADGTVVTHTDDKNALRKEILAVLGEWGAEDATMAKIA